MKIKCILMVLLFSILSINFLLVVNADDSDDWHFIGSWSGTLYNRSAVPLYPELIIDVEEENGNIFDIEWKTNATGVWETFEYNLSCVNGTYSQIAKWANQSEKTYWWYYTVKIDEYRNNSNIFKFTTAKYTWGDWSDTWVFSYAPQETRLISFSPVAFGESGMTFSLSLDVVAEGYSGPIYVNVSTRDVDDVIYPLNIEGENGKYIIKDLIFEVSPPFQDNQFRYPFDDYWVDIAFYKDDGKKLDFNNITTEEKVISHWKMKTQWDGNKLHLDFQRNQEQRSFYILVFLAGLSIFINILFLARKETKILSYLNEIISIPFFFGVIFNYMIYDCPTFFTISFLILIPLLIISLILGVIVYNKTKK